MKKKKNIGFIFIVLFTALFCLNIEAVTTKDLKKGIELFEKRKYSEAKEFFEAYTNLNPKNADAAFYLGKIFLIEENFDRSIDWFKKAIELNQDSSEYHLWLGRAFGLKIQKVSLMEKAPLAQECKKELEKALELDADNIDARFGLLQYYLSAPSFLGGSMEKAMEQAEEIKKRDSRQAHRALRMVYEAEGKHDLVEKEYLAEINEDPLNIELYYQLGYFYANLEKYDDAFKTFEKILEKNPEEMNAYYQIGRMGALSGENLNRAEECFKKYFQHKPRGNDPSLAWAHYRLGMVYEHKSEKELAKREYEAALKLEPDHKEAKKALESLEGTND